MTRDEAVGIVDLQAFKWSPTNIPNISEKRFSASGLVDAFVALGMLKLDEPQKDAWEMFERIFPVLPVSHARVAWAFLQANGLKIVKASP